MILKLFIIIPILLFPFCSVSQSPDFYEMFCESIRLEFFKYSFKEKLNQVDTLLIYGYRQNQQIPDSTLISKLFIGKSVDEKNVMKNSKGFVKQKGELDAPWLYSDKTFNSNRQLILNTLYLNDSAIYCRIKYEYKNKDTLSITKYLLESNDIFEQSIFEYKKKKTVEKTTYNYTSCITTHFVKKDKFNRMEFAEDCYCDSPYSIKIKYLYSKSTLIAKTEYPEYYEVKVVTDTFKYNRLGLLESKETIFVGQDSLVFTPSLSYFGSIKYFYK